MSNEFALRPSAKTLVGAILLSLLASSAGATEQVPTTALSDFRMYSCDHDDLVGRVLVFQEVEEELIFLDLEADAAFRGRKLEEGRYVFETSSEFIFLNEQSIVMTDGSEIEQISCTRLDHLLKEALEKIVEHAPQLTELNDAVHANYRKALAEANGRAELAEREVKEMEERVYELEGSQYVAEIRARASDERATEMASELNALQAELAASELEACSALQEEVARLTRANGVLRVWINELEEKSNE